LPFLLKRYFSHLFLNKIYQIDTLQDEFRFNNPPNAAKDSNKIFAKVNLESEINISEQPEIEANEGQNKVSQSEIIKDKVFSNLKNLNENNDQNAQKEIKKDIVEDLKEVLCRIKYLI
jgi:hypothetical protein